MFYHLETMLHMVFNRKDERKERKRGKGKKKGREERREEGSIFRHYISSS